MSLPSMAFRPQPTPNAAAAALLRHQVALADRATRAFDAAAATATGSFQHSLAAVSAAAAEDGGVGSIHNESPPSSLLSPQSGLLSVRHAAIAPASQLHQPAAATSSSSSSPAADFTAVATAAAAAAAVAARNYLPTFSADVASMYPRFGQHAAGAYFSPYVHPAFAAYRHYHSAAVMYSGAGPTGNGGGGSSGASVIVDDAGAAAAAAAAAGAAAAAARRKSAARETTGLLKAWLYEHRKNPYPTKGEKIMLAIITKMTLTQVSTWFANVRRRLKKENKMTWSPRHRCPDWDAQQQLQRQQQRQRRLISPAPEHEREQSSEADAASPADDTSRASLNASAQSADETPACARAAANNGGEAADCDDGCSDRPPSPEALLPQAESSPMPEGGTSSGGSDDESEAMQGVATSATGTILDRCRSSESGERRRSSADFNQKRMSPQRWPAHQLDGSSYCATAERKPKIWSLAAVATSSDRCSAASAVAALAAATAPAQPSSRTLERQRKENGGAVGGIGRRAFAAIVSRRSRDDESDAALWTSSSPSVAAAARVEDGLAAAPESSRHRRCDVLEASCRMPARESRTTTTTQDC